MSMKEVPLYELERGQKFKLYDDGPWMQFVKLDGLYGAVTDRFVPEEELEWEKDIAWLTATEKVYVEDED